MISILRKVFFFALSFLVFLFFVQNWDSMGGRVPLRMNLFFTGFQTSGDGMPVALFGILCILFGIVVGSLTGVFEALMRSFQLGSRDRRIRKLEAEMDRLRAETAKPAQPTLPGEPR